jgi:hypothetical protein
MGADPRLPACGPTVSTVESSRLRILVRMKWRPSVVSEEMKVVVILAFFRVGISVAVYAWR